jgi:hypothetical protein
LHHQSSHEAERPSDLDADARAIPTSDVFRALIEEELRSGRLTPSRRRRIVRYATAMGLSATEAGELITECQRQALEDADPTTRRHALRLVYPDPPLLPAGLKLALVVIVAIALDMLLVAALFGSG